MRTFEITFWHNGNKDIVKIEALSKYNAKVRFYFSYPHADIINVREVTE